MYAVNCLLSSVHTLSTRSLCLGVNKGEWNPLKLCTYAMYPRNVPMQCTHAICTHNVPTLCAHAMYTRHIHTQCTHTMYTHNVHTQCTHTMYPHNVPTQYTHTLCACINLGILFSVVHFLLKLQVNQLVRTKWMRCVCVCVCAHVYTCFVYERIV